MKFSNKNKAHRPEKSFFMENSCLNLVKSPFVYLIIAWLCESVQALAVDFLGGVFYYREKE